MERVQAWRIELWNGLRSGEQSHGTGSGLEDRALERVEVWGIEPWKGFGSGGYTGFRSEVETFICSLQSFRLFL